MERRLLVVAVALAMAGCAAFTRDEVPAAFQSGVLVDTAKSMTLYTFDRDPAGRGESLCVDECAKNWPPFVPSTDAKATGPFSIIGRDDGTLQWAYDGKPLYHWAKDRKPGDRTGDGVNNLWRVVKP